MRGGWKTSFYIISPILKPRSSSKFYLSKYVLNLTYGNVESKIFSGRNALSPHLRERGRKEGEEGRLLMFFFKTVACSAFAVR